MVYIIEVRSSSPFFNFSFCFFERTVIDTQGDASVILVAIRSAMKTTGETKANLLTQVKECGFGCVNLSCQSDGSDQVNPNKAWTSKNK